MNSPKTCRGVNSFEPEDKYVEIHGLRFHYLDWGNVGHQPVLLLHGFMAHAHMWDQFAARFKDHYHVLALDQRGHGESEWSKELSYTIDDHFLDITTFIETLDLKDLVLVGHSMGGRNALFYTALSPQKVDRLILVEARPSNKPGESDPLRHLLIHLPLQAKSFDEVVHAVYELFPYLPRKICYHIARYGYRQTDDGGFVPKYDVRMGLHAERSGYATEDLWAFLKNLPCPTLVIRGEGSAFLTRDDARKMCDVIPRAVWKEITNTTHMPAQENPAAFEKVISDFLGLPGNAFHKSL